MGLHMFTIAAVTVILILMQPNIEEKRFVGFQNTECIAKK
jgi:hypothetical protein